MCAVVCWCVCVVVWRGVCSRHTRHLTPPPTIHHHDEQRGEKASVGAMRAILLAPVAKFEQEHAGYAAYLAQHLVNDGWPTTRGQVRRGCG